MKSQAQEDARIEQKAKEAVADVLRALFAVNDVPKAKLSAKAKMKRCAILKVLIKDLLASAKTPERQKALMAKLSRVERIEKEAQKRSIALSHIHQHTICLEERAYKPIRRLTLQENRVDFESLNEDFNDIQAELEKELAEATDEEIERALANAKNKLDAGDIAAVAAILFLFRTRVRDTLTKAVKASYDVGKESMAKEIGVDRPPTPLQDKQMMNVDAKDIAEGYAANLEGTLASALKAGIIADASTAAIIAAARQAVVDEAAKEITNISGTVVGQYINMGRNNVIFSNVEKVVAMQRSEVLDMRTCALCLSLDERVVTPTDPMAYMKEVHTHCRGVWVPILAIDEVKPDVTGIPKSISDAFDTIDGRPIINGFKQLKKPINDVSKPAMEEIRKRFEAKKK